jgi:glutathione synthase/RimK-type ligase-like ATP-grasp enzyme
MTATPTGVVLIVTHGEDNDHADRVTAALAERGSTAVRFDTELYPERATVAFTASRSGAEIELRSDDYRVRARDVAAVLYRHRRLPLAPEVADPSARRMVESERLALLDGALLSIDAFWVNHPTANQFARHKPVQLRFAHAEGFELPPTYITADPAVVRRLWHEWDGQMVAKLVGGQVIQAPGEEPYAVFTTQLDAADLSDEAAIAAAPAIYQQLLPKAADVRVTVVGDDVFACRIPSQLLDESRVDWRRVGRRTLVPEKFTLDRTTARRCAALNRRLGLEMSGIDLALMPDGRLVFLEVNASGQWAWVEEATGMPIAAAIARLLSTHGAVRQQNGGQPVGGGDASR